MQTEEYNLLQRIADLRSTRESSLVIAATGDSFSSVLAEHIELFCLRETNIKTQLLQVNFDQMVALAREGKADLCFGRINELPADLSGIPWRSLDHYLIGPQDHPIWSEARQIELRDLARFPLIIPPVAEFTRTTSDLHTKLREHGLTAEVALECPNVERSIEYARRHIGLYFALCTQEMLGDIPDGMVCHPINHLFESRDYGAFVASTRPISPGVARFLDEIGLQF
ncbi:LysR family transcriptional regulator substrate-binding protein [Roseovarius sp. 2305UL8-3]|uniref:LysR family transcriptional regulator substrate-binding protein n=1 Tax=Roseovarius conchicola TaxID=3121636 RepID=UPI003526CB7B